MVTFFKRKTHITFASVGKLTFVFVKPAACECYVLCSVYIYVCIYVMYVSMLGTYMCTFEYIRCRDLSPVYYGMV
jgi:hypothetical protein